MEFTSRFINFASHPFWYREYYSTPHSLSEELSLDDNNVFNRSIIVDLNKDEIELPVIAIRHFEDLATSKSSSSHCEKVVFSLYNNSFSQTRRTFDSIMYQFFAGTSYNCRLLKITTNKGEVYYGGKGIIFDGNYNPLLLCTLKARRVVKDNECYTAYYRPVCYVHPRVFTEPNTIVNKGIIKKLIPFYTSHNMSFPLGPFRDEAENKRVQVIVDDFDRFFIKPVKPKLSSCTNELLNQCLVDNIEDIIALI